MADAASNRQRSNSKGPGSIVANALASVFGVGSSSSSTADRSQGRSRADSYTTRPSYDAASRHFSNESEKSALQSNPVLARGRAGNPQTDIAREASRSASRGREAFSTGRGGAGNIKPSPSRDTGVSDGDMRVIHEAQERSRSRIRSSGRGGAGNVAHPLGQTPEAVQEEEDARKYEDAVRRKHNEQVGLMGNQSVGRGGAGNIASRSPSRAPRSNSRGPGPRSSLSSSTTTPHQDHTHAHAHNIDLHSTGRGGSGNITSANPPPGGLAADELAKAQHFHAMHDAAHGEHHTTGRGGFGNLHDGPAPRNIDVPPPLREADEAEGVSTGRGGTGNISHGQHGGVHGLIDKIIHPTKN